MDPSTVAQILDPITDEQLIAEIRRRGRVQRLEASYILEGWKIAQGSSPPDDYIIERLYRQIGHALWCKSPRLPGIKIEEGHFIASSYHTKDRKFTIPINFVVEKP